MRPRMQGIRPGMLIRNNDNKKLYVFLRARIGSRSPSSLMAAVLLDDCGEEVITLMNNVLNCYTVVRET